MRKLEDIYYRLCLKMVFLREYPTPFSDFTCSSKICYAIEVYFHTSSLILPDHPNTDHPNPREAYMPQYTTAITNAISSRPGVVSKETDQFSKTIIYV